MDAWTLLLGAAALFSCFCALRAWRSLREARAHARALAAFPGPGRHWLYGNAHCFPNDERALQIELKFSKEYSFATPLWFGPTLGFLSMTHPDYARAVLTSSEPKDDVAYEFLIPWIGNGLLVLSGPKWFRNRRLLTPGFHYEILKPYIAIIGQSTASMLDKWERLSEKQSTFEVYGDISLLMLDSILTCAFSYEGNCQTETGNSYVRAVYELTDLVDRRFRNFALHNKWVYYLTPDGWRFQKAKAHAHKHTEEVIRRRRETLKLEAQQHKTQQKRNLDFLDILLSARDADGQSLSDEEIRAEVDTFMFEGHDTTASGLSWVLHALASNPHHQEVCRDEAARVLAGRSQPEWDDMSNLPYTTMVIKESLRLYPPVPGIGRKLTQPLKLPHGHVLPAGMRVGVSIFCIHRNEEFWKDPEVFDPLRFSQENSAHRHPYAFIPFSAGPRNCIGQNFALNELRVTVAMILSRFRIHSASPPAWPLPQPIPRIVLRSNTGFHFRFERVEPLKYGPK